MVFVTYGIHSVSPTILAGIFRTDKRGQDFCCSLQLYHIVVDTVLIINTLNI